MSKLTYLVIHCTATQEGRELTAEDIRKMHTSPPPKGRGWSQVGYSDMIHLNGVISNLVPYNEDDIVQPREVTNGALGLNGVARHVVYVGGVEKDGKTPKDTRTNDQHLALRNYVNHVLSAHPHVIVLGHNQVAAKACPSFDVPTYLRKIGIKEANIYKKANSI
jgi:N-acetylmuramoyl-L-alanine amidase